MGIVGGKERVVEGDRKTFGKRDGWRDAERREKKGVS